MSEIVSTGKIPVIAVPEHTGFLRELELPEIAEHLILPLREFNRRSDIFGNTRLTREELGVLLEHGPFLEIGAGNGYIQKCLQAMASLVGSPCDILSFDKQKYTDSSDGTGRITSKTWGHVQLGGIEKISLHTSGRTLLMCFPPENSSGENPMALEALSEYSNSGGKKLIYIGDPNARIAASDGTRITESQPGFISAANDYFGEPIFRKPTALSYTLHAYEGELVINVNPEIFIWEKRI